MQCYQVHPVPSSLIPLPPLGLLSFTLYLFNTDCRLPVSYSLVLVSRKLLQVESRTGKERAQPPGPCAQMSSMSGAEG